VSADVAISDLFGDADELRAILDRFPRQRVAVVGDFFLDKYLVIDAALEEPSLETGLPAHQVVELRNSPGAAGTVVNNLVALDAGKVAAFGVVGDDGPGYELRAALTQRGVDVSSLQTEPSIVTPTYMKPVRRTSDDVETELSRLDVLNRRPASGLGARVAAALAERIADFDAVVVVDQVADSQGGVVDAELRSSLSVLGERHPNVFILADSRCSVGAFDNVRLKPNIHEARRALASELESPVALAKALAVRARRDVFLTCGAGGVVASSPDGATRRVRGVVVPEPTDPTGAGDSASAGITLASASGATNLQAAAVGCLVASITVQQLRTTGTASRQQVLTRFDQLGSPRGESRG
jgi:bifunctional ADP-heptose synthase (sugar kinase/adenylyltransferase)